MWKFSKENAGEFQHKETRCHFTYKATNDAWATSHGFTHEIDVLDGVRFARVLKTVAHVAVDEDEFGCPVIEYWQIKNTMWHVAAN